MEQILVTVPTDGNPLSIPEILYTVAYLRGTYLVAGRHILRSHGSLEPAVNLAVTELAAELSVNMTHHFPDQKRLIDYLTQEGRTELSAEFAWADLTLVNITRKNPVELVVLALAVPLTIAVILSGGKLHLGPLRVELPPIGNGVLALRKALQPLPSQRIKERAEAKAVKLHNE